MTFLGIVDAVLFKPLQLLFEVIYVAAYKMIQDPGLSIIALSLVMNFLILPLYMRADAMQEEEREIEKRLHPGVSHIKRTFKGDEKMMILQTYYRQNDYKPTYVLRSAVSLLLEIPFFIAAYRFLSGLELLKGVSFGPIADLGQADGLINIGGTAINLLPIIMTAVNLVSCVIFTKGSPLKTKIQLYAMAIFFLFFLYSSPSGLVFYWTLNNVFSLVKTVFYKLKHPGKVLAVLSAVCGAAAVVFGAFFYPSGTFVKKAFVIVAGILLILPVFFAFIKKEKENSAEPKPNGKLFFACMAFLAVLLGLTIPISVIKSSPQEFYTLQLFVHPVWYVVNCFCIAFGAFVVWLGVFYKLVKPKTKVIFERVGFTLCGVAVADYMFFGKDLGILSPNLTFESGMAVARNEKLINLAVVAAVIAVFLVLSHFFRKQLFAVMAVFVVALSVMVPFDTSRIISGVGQVIEKSRTENELPQIKLSENGKNVVVLMLDRAIGMYTPYIFNEFPELEEKFDGFCSYTNTISYGANTNFGAPALFGGYEYTPEEINRRDKEPLVKKHNEALLVMPTLFGDNGYKVTVVDPPYANYNWKTDLSIYKDIPNFSGFAADGVFTPVEINEEFINSNMRNFFIYSIMKSSPVAVQKIVYDSGRYYRSDVYNDQASASVQSATDALHSTGLDPLFMNAYYVLDGMSNITVVEDGNDNTFLSMVSNLTHEAMLLREPDYMPSPVVDNTEYEKKASERFSYGGHTLKTETVEQAAHYQINVCALKKLGEWMDFLREQGVYDNTRIILVADHGGWLNQRDDLQTPQGFDITSYLPLLMVKDFDSHGFSFSDEFMTNADVPLLALDGLVESPVNPFTGKKLTDDTKNDPVHYVINSEYWNVDENNGNTFRSAIWLALEGKNAYDSSKWSVNSADSVMPVRTK